MTNRSAFVLVAVVAATLWGCGSVAELAGDGGADQAGDLDAAPSDKQPENPSDGAAGEVAPVVDAGAELPACRAPAMLGAACSGQCYRCLGPDFATLAKAGELCAPSCVAAGQCSPATVCAADCGECP